MPPIVVLALGALAAGAIIHRAVKELRRINAELDRVKEGRAIDRDGLSEKATPAKASRFTSSTRTAITTTSPAANRSRTLGSLRDEELFKLGERKSLRAKVQYARNPASNECDELAPPHGDAQSHQHKPEKN